MAEDVPMIQEEFEHDVASVKTPSNGKSLENNDKKEGPNCETNSQFSSQCKLPL